MIIHGILAENVLKYERLELLNLPESGLIAVSGQNESGKSTIGETICFAIFGRTFSLGPEDIDKLIRWGATRCSVTLTFSAGDEKRYTVERFLDNDGNHAAQLFEAGKENDPVARGVDAVDEAMFNIAGFDFDEFIESFYLAQREITTPHPHSYAIKAMAGIAPLEHCIAEFEEEIDDEREEIKDIELKIADVDQQMEELAIDEDRLSGLEGQLANRQVVEQQQQDRIQTLESASVDYQDSAPKLARAKGSRRSAGFLRFLFFVLALAAAGLWAALTQFPDAAVSGRIVEQLARIPRWDPVYLPWILYAAAGLGVFFILSWIRCAVLNGRISKLKEPSADLAARLEDLQLAAPIQRSEEEDESEEDVEDEQTAEADAEEKERATLAADDPWNEEAITAPNDEARFQLQKKVADSSATVTEVRDGVGIELAWLRKELQDTQEGIVRIEEEINHEKGRLDRAARLKDARTGFEDSIRGHEHRIELRNLGSDLLLGAINHMSQQFNHDLRGLVGRTLPLFTDNRYEHLQIDNDLTVRVFSSEKRDFMDLDEISSGTQRQIMLAVRLALSQELINRAVEGEQFVFLDEPFAFFDEQRTRSALAVLPTLSDEITQTWIVSQAFPTDMGFNMRLECSRDATSLTGPAEP